MQVFVFTLSQVNDFFGFDNGSISFFIFFYGWLFSCSFFCCIIFFLKKGRLVRFNMCSLG